MTSLSFSADKSGYVERFETILKASQSVVVTDSERVKKINEQWQLLLADYPADKAVANNYAVFLMSINQYSDAQIVLEKALRYEASTKLLSENLNKVYAFQAQQAYQGVFDETNLTIPQGQWSTIQQKINKNLSLARVTALNNSMEKVANQIENWRASWADQNSNLYLSFYKNDFLGKGFKSHKSWRATREYSLKNPKFIKIVISNVTLFPMSETLIRAEFFQNYQSNRFKDTIKKSLTWQLLQGEWKIVNESIIYN